jgi:hypothetical protein
MINQWITTISPWTTLQHVAKKLAFSQIFRGSAWWSWFSSPVFSAEAIFASLARSSASFCASLALLSSASFSFFARSSSYQWRHLVVLGPFGWQFQECWAPFLGCRQAGSEVEPKWVWVNIEPPKKVAVVITYTHCIIYANIYSTCTC